MARAAVDAVNGRHGGIMTEPDNWWAWLRGLAWALLAAYVMSESLRSLGL